MSADVLRRAAALMRERAEAATPSPWNRMAPAHVWGGGKFGKFVADCFDEPVHSASDAGHIAAWHPAVALAVANLLEHIADDMHDDNAEEREHPRVDGGTYTAVHPNNFSWDQGARWDWTEALALARAYLGEQS